MTKERLAEWRAYYTDLQVGCDVHDDYQHILDIITALESAQESLRNAEEYIEQSDNWEEYEEWMQLNNGGLNG